MCVIQACQWRKRFPTRFLIPVPILLALAGTAFADIENEATAIGRFGVQAVISNNAGRSVPVSAPAPAVTLSMAGEVRENDGMHSAGDEIFLGLSAVNVGNIALTNPVIDSSGTALAFSGGDANGNGVMDIGEEWEFAGTYLLRQSDIDHAGADGTMEFAAALEFDQLPQQSVGATIPIERHPDLSIRHSLARLSSAMPFVFTLAIDIDVANTGNVTLNDIEIGSDLDEFSEAGTNFAGEVAAVSGFGGQPAVNAGFDGVENRLLFSERVDLAPGQSGKVRLNIVIDTAGRNRTARIVTTASADDVILSTGTGELAQAGAEIAATSFPLADSDADGAPDGVESKSQDRDSDGTPDAIDYDPSGYFYCESNGRIVPGGRITIESVATGKRIEGEGANDEFAIFADGRNGRFQFHANEPGRYRLAYQPPPAARRSAQRTPVEFGAEPGIPVLIAGSGEMGATGRLADPSAQANPFALEFELGPGKPVIFNNNIPLRLCGAPRIAGSIFILDNSPGLRVGEAHLAYRITVENSGDEQLEAIRVGSDLASDFGRDNFRIAETALESAPPGFGASINPYFDGDGDTGLLTSGGVLKPGERAEIRLRISVGATGDEFVAAARVEGLSPVDRRSLSTQIAADPVVVSRASGTPELLVRKSAGSEFVSAGEEISFTLTVSNGQSVERAGVDIVDRMPPGFSYVGGTAKIDGVPREPRIAGDELVWPGLAIPANSAVRISAELRAPENFADAGTENQLFARDSESGTIVSNAARAGFSIIAAGPPGCRVAEGIVFVDVNGDGLRQRDEQGLDGVRINFGGSAGVESDATGRYALTCQAAENASIAGRVRLTVDPDSLPRGLASASSPTVVVDSGQIARYNLAVRPTGEIRIELDAADFEPGNVILRREMLGEISRLLARFTGEAARARVSYAESGDDELAQERLDFVAALVGQAWSQRFPDIELSVVTETVAPRQ